MTQSSVPLFRTNLRQWDRLVFAWAYLLTPGLALLAVLFLSRPLPGFATVVALLLAAVGTSLQSYLELRRLGRRAVTKPHERAAPIREMQPAGLVWGLAATASWVGLFAQLVG